MVQILDSHPKSKLLIHITDVWPNPVNLTIQNPDTKRLRISNVRISGRYCLTFVYLSVDDGGQAEVVKDLSAISPDRDAAVLPETLVVKSVHLSDLTGLVVPTDQGYPVRVPNLAKKCNLKDVLL